MQKKQHSAEVLKEDRAESKLLRKVDESMIKIKHAEADGKLPKGTCEPIDELVKKVKVMKEQSNDEA